MYVRESLIRAPYRNGLCADCCACSRVCAYRVDFDNEKYCMTIIRKT